MMVSKLLKLQIKNFRTFVIKIRFIIRTMKDLLSLLK